MYQYTLVYEKNYLVTWHNLGTAWSIGGSGSLPSDTERFWNTLLFTQNCQCQSQRQKLTLHIAVRSSTLALSWSIYSWPSWRFHINIIITLDHRATNWSFHLLPSNLKLVIRSLPVEWDDYRFCLCPSICNKIFGKTILVCTYLHMGACPGFTAPKRLRIILINALHLTSLTHWLHQ